MATSALLGSGIMGCGGSTDPRSDPVVGAGGTTGTGGGAAPTAGGTGGDPGSAQEPGSTIFAQNYGDEGEQALAGLAVDGSGNIYVAGNEMPENIAQPSGSTGPLPMQGTAKGVFLLQYSPSGELKWRQPFVPGPNAFQLQVNGVAVQQTTGLEILVGTVGGTVTLDGTTLTSGVDKTGVSVSNLWLTAVDSAGYLVWTKLIPSPGAVFPDQVFVTSSGDIEVTGGMVDNATVGGAPLCCGDGATGPRFAARFSPTGDPIWSSGVTGFFRPVSSGADADGGLVLGGLAEGPFGYKGESFSSGGGPFEIFSAVVLRLDAQGNKRWIQTYINKPGSSLAGAAVDQAQNVVVHGEFSGPFDLGGGHTFTGPAPTSGTMDGFIAKLAPDGTTQWAQQIPGGLGQQFGARVATNAAGDIALTNNGDGFSAGPSFGGVSPLPAGSIGQYIVELAPDGTFLWSRGFPTASGLAPPTTGLAFDPSGRLAAAGNFDNTVDFGTGPLTVPGQLVRNGSGPEWVADNVFTLLLAP